jgi:putative membrane protein
MPGLLLRWALNAFALWVVSVIVPGIHADGIAATFVAALVLGILNALVRPIVLLLTLPINLLTLGLFTFVINALMLEMTSGLVRGFTVDNFGSALICALLLSLVSFVLNVFVNEHGRIGHIHVEVRRF